MKILIADDSKASRMFLKNMIETILSSAEIEFLFAEDGDVAIQRFAEADPDLVFLDLTMPKKNGMEALQAILALNPEAKVVVVTADAQKASHDKALTIGALDYITKPIPEHTLARKLLSWL